MGNPTTRLSKRQREVLRIMSQYEAGVTDQQLIQHAVTREGMSHNTPRARRVELRQIGLVEVCGKEGGRLVWRLSADGQFALQQAEGNNA